MHLAALDPDLPPDTGRPFG